MGGVSDQRPGLFTMLGRAMRRHCPRCGAKGIFSSWFKMKERCPRCDLQFEGPPEEGFFLGTFTINLTLTLGVLLIAMFVYIGAMAVGDPPSLAAYVIVSSAACVIIPILFHPLARTIWVAFELAMHNMDDSLKGRRGSQGHARGAGR